MTAFAALLAFPASSTGQDLRDGRSAPEQVRVAIYRLDDAQIRDTVRELMPGKSFDYGRIAADLILPALAGPRVSVVTRDQLEQLMKEQNFKYSDRFDAATAPQLGQLFGVDAIVTGKLVAFSLDRRQNVKGLPLIGTLKLRNVPTVSRTVTEVTASVEVTAELISASTGGVLAAPTQRVQKTFTVGSGTEVRVKNPKTGRADVFGGDSTGVQATNDRFMREVVRDAIRQAGAEVARAASMLTPNDGGSRDRLSAGSSNVSGTGRLNAPTALPLLPGNPSKYEPLDGELGTVLRVAEGTVIFALLDDAHVAVGDKLEVHRAELLKDAVGRPVLVGQKIGIIEITEVKSKYSRGTVSGHAVAANDRVIRPAADPVVSAPIRRRPATNAPTPEHR